MQNNSNTGINPGYRTQNVINIQPVIPVKFSENWNLIIRWITPIIYQPLGPGVGVSGLGDMQPTFLLSPSKPHKLIRGLGPSFNCQPRPANTLDRGSLASGLNFVASCLCRATSRCGQQHRSVAGGGSRADINQLLLQYFVNDNLKKGWYLTTQPILTANWNSSAASGSVWTVPFGGGVGRIMKLGFQPVNISVQAYGNAIHVPGASSWNVRASIALLFPKLTKEQEKMMMEQKLKQLDQEPPKKK